MKTARTLDVSPLGGIFSVLTESKVRDWRTSGYRYVLPRDPKRDPEQLKRELATAYAQHRGQAHVDASAIVSVRRTRLRLVRRTA